jgi:mRNA interferase RelE/StbE
VKYEVYILRAAEREMDKLTPEVYRRISRRLLSLEENPRPPGSKKLSVREEYRLRSGDYRILYTVDDEKRTVTVFAIGHRREVYR